MLKKVKKILPILCACLLLFGSTLTVSASEITELLLPTENMYEYCLVYDYGSFYQLFTSDKP